MITVTKTGKYFKKIVNFRGILVKFFVNLKIKVAQAWHEPFMSRIEKNQKTCQICDFKCGVWDFFVKKKRSSKESVFFLVESAVTP